MKGRGDFFFEGADAPSSFPGLSQAPPDFSKELKRGLHPSQISPILGVRKEAFY